MRIRPLPAAAATFDADRIRIPDEAVGTQAAARPVPDPRSGLPAA